MSQPFSPKPNSKKCADNATESPWKRLVARLGKRVLGLDPTLHERQKSLHAAMFIVASNAKTPAFVPEPCNVGVPVVRENHYRP